PAEPLRVGSVVRILVLEVREDRPTRAIAPEELAIELEVLLVGQEVLGEEELGQGRSRRRALEADHPQYQLGNEQEEEPEEHRDESRPHRILFPHSRGLRTLPATRQREPPCDRMPARILRARMPAPPCAPGRLLKFR